MPPAISGHRAKSVATIVAVITALVLDTFLRAVCAQLPQPRITSLSRAGVRSGESVEVTVRGSDLEGVNELWFDHPGLNATHQKDLSFRVTCAPNVPLGHHDVRAVGALGVSNPRAFVVGDRPEQGEIEPNNTPERATPITVGAVASGEISAATDVDCFSFDGRKGERLYFDLQAERIDSRLDATLRILTNSGSEIAESRDVFGLDPFLDVTLPADGRYVLKIHDAVYAGSPDHFYRLLVHDGPHVDAIRPLAAPPGSEGAFTVLGRGLGPGGVSDPSLLADGHPLERLAVTIGMPEAGAIDPSRFRMMVPPASAGAGPGLEYAYTRLDKTGAVPVTSELQLIAQAAYPVVAEQEPNNDESHAQRVIPPCDISGSFDKPGDLDLFRFEGRKGKVWIVEAIAERQGSPADPVVLIQKAGAKGAPPQDLASGDDLADDGAEVRFNTQSVDASVRWQVPDDGLYQIQISDLYSSERGDPRLGYRLLIRPERPDFRLIVIPNNPASTDALTVRAGGRTSASVLALRRDGFSGPIRVEETAAPAGVRFDPVVIGPGQALAPVVFKAAPEAKTTIGTVKLIGRAHFGDRKDELTYVPGATRLGPDLVRPALAGGMTWPPAAKTATLTPARLFHGLVIAVRSDPAPLTLTARPANWTVAQGRQVNLEMEVTRRAGFVEAVDLAASDLPPNMPPATGSIPKQTRTGLLPLFVPRNVPPGTYSFVVRGSGPYPFNKDPKAKEKPTLTLTEPSNPITLIVRPAPLSLTVDAKGGVVKQGQRLDVEVSAARQNGFTGTVTITLNAPPGLKLSADRVVLAKDRSKTKLVIKAAGDSPLGTVANATVRATAVVRGESIEVDEPLALSIGKQ
jgi:hypothetical protein